MRHKLKAPPLKRTTRKRMAERHALRDAPLLSVTRKLQAIPLPVKDAAPPVIEVERLEPGVTKVTRADADGHSKVYVIKRKGK